jgi:hypothetical protein
MTEAERWAADEIICALAGPAAARRCLHGGEPGWRSVRSTASIVAHHEAGHGIAAAVVGFCPIHLDLVETLGRSGVCVRARPGAEVSPECLQERLAERLESDHRRAVKLCVLLARTPEWRATLRVVRTLRRQAEALVDAHWLHVTALAAELERRGVLSRQEIEGFLPRTTDAPTTADKPALAACSATRAPVGTGAPNTAT